MSMNQFHGPGCTIMESRTNKIPIKPPLSGFMMAVGMFTGN